jgi:hypothetical protein
LRGLLRCVLHECGELGLVLHQLRLAQAVRLEPVRVVQLGPVRRRPESLELELEQGQTEPVLLGPVRPVQKPVPDLQVLQPGSRVA